MQNAADDGAAQAPHDQNAAHRAVVSDLVSLVEDVQNSLRLIERTIDGPWRRDCPLNAISDTDATLTVEGSIQGLNLKEFFLLLSSTGLAYRRCELVRVNGTEMDIRFLRGKNAKKKSGGSKKEEAMH